MCPTATDFPEPPALPIAIEEEHERVLNRMLYVRRAWGGQTDRVRMKRADNLFSTIVGCRLNSPHLSGREGETARAPADIASLDEPEMATIVDE
jgi:hypothetical protein